MTIPRQDSKKSEKNPDYKYGGEGNCKSFTASFGFFLPGYFLRTPTVHFSARDPFPATTYSRLSLSLDP